MNSYTLSISTTKSDINAEKILNQIDLFDLTEFTLDLTNVYTEIFPNYLSIDWGDGSELYSPI